MKNIKDIFSRVIGGIILIVVGIGLLLFNETSNLKNNKTANEGRKVAVDIAGSPVNPKNNNKLVNISGSINILDNTIDSIFNIGVKTVKLVRKTEMYQWVENKDKTYSKKWSDKVIDSNTFKQSTKHQNPTDIPFGNLTLLASNVKIGDFIVNTIQKDMLSANNTLSTLPKDVILPTGYQISNKYITSSTNLQAPQIGDVRISFMYNNDTKATILGMQSGSSLIDYQTSNKKTISLMKAGIYNAKQMLGYVEKGNSTLVWVLRGVEIFLIITGIAIILNQKKQVL